MLTNQEPEQIDTRLIFRAYSLLVGAGGLILMFWGPMWLGSHMSGEPWGKAALIRVFGSIAVAAACCSAGFASGNDLDAMRRGLFWFGSGHIVVAGVVLLQRIAVWGEGATWAAQLLLTAALILVCMWIDTVSRRSVLTSWLSNIGPRSTSELRSRYEQQIREAARQEERNRMARDLHDAIKQQIFAIQTAAATVQARFDDDRSGAQQAVEQIRSSAREAGTEMQVMLDQLRAVPLENNGLVESLKKQCEAMGFRSGARVEFQLGDLPSSDALPPGAHEAFLRVAQEALANIGRHARAGSVRVSLGSVHNVVRLSIRDNGAGFDPNRVQHGLGITNMRARAEEFGGTFELASRPGNGTSVEFSIPCVEPGARPRYLRNAVVWGVVLAVPPLALVFTGHWVVPGATMVCAMAAFGLLRNLSAHKRVQASGSR